MGFCCLKASLNLGKELTNSHKLGYIHLPSLLPGFTLAGSNCSFDQVLDFNIFLNNLKDTELCINLILSHKPGPQDKLMIKVK